MHLHTIQKAYVVYNFNYGIETRGPLEVTGTNGNISTTVHDRDIGTTDH